MPNVVPAPTTPVYALKQMPFSSHTLLLHALPALGTGKRVLDLGCGNGYLSRLLADRGFEVTGIERQGGYTDEFPECVDLIEADLENGLPALRGCFDYVLCADILEHVRYPDRLLREVRHLLAPGGSILASLPNSGNIWFRLNVLFGRFPKDEKGLFDRTHLHFFMWKGWVELFWCAGFRLVDQQATPIPVSLLVPESLRLRPPARLAESACYAMARIWMKLFAYQFVVRALPLE